MTSTFHIHRQRIKDALNVQTYSQFLQYAQQQFPGNVDQQAILIRQLQDQHYQQYIQQLAVNKRLANAQIADAKEPEEQHETGVDTNTEEVVKDCNLNEVETADDLDNNM